MTTLLTATAAIEAGAGLVLAVWPSLLTTVLLGIPLEGAAATIVGRVAGAALLALAVACWLARREVTTGAARGLIVGILLYNTSVVALLVIAGTRSELFGVGLWPGAALHAAMGLWCLRCLWNTSSRRLES